MVASTAAAQAVVKMARSQFIARVGCQEHGGDKERQLKADSEVLTRWLASISGSSGLSWRGIDNVAKVARTIADCEQSPNVTIKHLQMAKSLRQETTRVSV